MSVSDLAAIESHPATRNRVRSTQFSDAAELEAYLSKQIEGEVRFDDASRAMYATDASNYRQVPIGVVVPKTQEDVIEAIAACRRFSEFQ